MTLFGACVLRRTSTIRPRSLVRLCDSEVPKGSPSFYISRRHHTTIYSAKRPFRNPERRASEDSTEILFYVLRQQTGRELGFENREDDHVSIKLLLNHPEFRRLDMETLQKLVDKDFKHRFDLQFDPTKLNDQWWLRARKWDEMNRFLKPIDRASVPPQIVYPTTLDNWNRYISRIGLPRLQDPYIRLECGIPAANYLNSLNDQHEVFIFLDVRKCMDQGMHFFTALPIAQPNGRPDHLLTKGNGWGFIPLEFFSKVDLVQAKKTLLWGNPQPMSKLPWSREDMDFDKKGMRKTFVRQPDRNLHGFVDVFPGHNFSAPPNQADILEEAKDILEEIKSVQQD